MSNYLNDQLHELDVSSNAIRVPCSHHYCLTCLEQFFELAIADQSVFPPRCCSEAISIVSISFFLKPIVVQTFDKKKIEFETRDKVYCSSRRRSTFIPPSNIVKDIGTCPKCNVKTHTMCKSKAHAGKCSQDASIEEVMDLARDNYWQRCYRCWALVDSVDGCDQIACLYGAYFCHRCGKKWKMSKEHFCEPESPQLFTLPKTRSWPLLRLFTRIFRSNKP
ncbi:hypothetical protein BofuT4_P062700.1 [Botrytis cinerea T4]|uniref:RING-type domain-containing protein n=1 Tax=Botryotinia fuckeliana (strain T4) TaxID=999810 RepID=G2XTK4_BOTF4|nr:hypothetical protein BofuT4_P062700.1 [Botrytis cinerea T4]